MGDMTLRDHSFRLRYMIHIIALLLKFKCKNLTSILFAFDRTGGLEPAPHKKIMRVRLDAFLQSERLGRRGIQAAASQMVKLWHGHLWPEPVNQASGLPQHNETNGGVPRHLREWISDCVTRLNRSSAAFGGITSTQVRQRFCVYPKFVLQKYSRLRANVYKKSFFVPIYICNSIYCRRYTTGYCAMY